MPLKLKVYIGAVTGLAIALIIYLASSLSLTTNMWWELIFFIILSTIAEFMPVELPVGGDVTIGFPIDFVVILVYGPATAIIVTSFSAFIGEIVGGKARWYKILFNMAQYTLSAGIAGRYTRD